MAKEPAQPVAVDPKTDLRALGSKLHTGRASLDELAAFLDALMPEAVLAVNRAFAPRQLSKQARKVEPLPLEKRQLSSYRTRLGTMLEYALSTHLDADIKGMFGEDLRLTFAVAHEYADFYMRDEALRPRVRIEMKAVDADSEEQAARFEVLSGLIQGDKDIVVLIGWEWFASTTSRSRTECEHPQIFSYVVVPAKDLASERDQSVTLRGGKVTAESIFVPSKKQPGQLTIDKGNAGKILRLVHQSRRAEPFKLSKSIQKYLQFVDAVASRVSATPKPASATRNQTK